MDPGATGARGRGGSLLGLTGQGSLRTSLGPFRWFTLEVAHFGARGGVVAGLTMWIRREPLLTATVASLPVLFLADFLTPDVFIPNFFVLPLVVTAALGRPRVTLVVTAMAVPLASVALAYSEEITSVAVARLVLITASGLVSAWVASIVATSRQRMRESNESLRTLAENASDIVFRSSPAAVIEWVSPSVERELGYHPDEMVGRPVGSFVQPDDVAVMLAASRELNTSRPVDYRVRFQHARGGLTWLEVTARPVIRGGEVIGHVGSARCIDRQVRLEEELRRQATTDDLTGADRREQAMRHLESLQHAHQRTGHESAVIFCDVDNFKLVNDTYGHGGGDEVLRQLADRLRSNLREEDSVARFGGDEFVVVLHSIHSLQDAQRIADKLHMATYLPIRLRDGREVQATLSMGLTPIRPGETIPEVLERADQALYEAKETGRDRVVCHA